jgi:omega-6 fatty acid desaturase (delta-12 desaturase)
MALVEQKPIVIPDLSVKDLLSAIPSHCYKRSALRSSSYVVWDLFVITCIYKTAVYADSFIKPEQLSLAYASARFAIWSMYGFAAGLFATGLWVIAHECGHQAFSESKTINNSVGWVLHSALGVPYHSWRITHAKHHASAGHMTQDQIFVPKTRSERHLPPIDASKEDPLGSRVSDEVKNELWDALGDSPIGAVLECFTYLLVGWPAYLTTNASGQQSYPCNSNHFNPSAVMFAPHHYGKIILSNVGIFIWLSILVTWTYRKGFLEVFTLYLVPYLWVNHWLVLIVFLQHTDPVLPHYRASEFTFPRGALSTLDRNLMGDCGKLMSWLGAHATHGISETHVVHHVSSKIPHYNAWEATDALRKRLGRSGIELKGGPGGWAEVYRVFRECKFVEDEGGVVFYKNAYGLAPARPVFADASDSGIEVGS